MTEISTINKIKCKRCGKTKHRDDYYIRAETGKPRLRCKLCTVSTISYKGDAGRLIKNMELARDGLKKCNHCLKILPLSEFGKRDKGNRYIGDCKKCSNKYQSDYKIKKGGVKYPSYNKWLAKARFGVPIECITDEISELIKIEQEIKSKLFIYFNELKFKSDAEFARYLLKEYNMPISQTESRLRRGHTESECLIPECFFRSIQRSKGQIKVTNIQTKEVKIYGNKTSCMRGEHVCGDRLNRYLNSGEIRKPYRNSKNRNHLKFEYYDK